MRDLVLTWSSNIFSKNDGLDIEFNLMFSETDYGLLGIIHFINDLFYFKLIYKKIFEYQ